MPHDEYLTSASWTPSASERWGGARGASGLRGPRAVASRTAVRIEAAERGQGEGLHGGRAVLECHGPRRLDARPRRWPCRERPLAPGNDDATGGRRRVYAAVRFGSRCSRWLVRKPSGTRRAVGLHGGSRVPSDHDLVICALVMRGVRASIRSSRTSPASFWGSPPRLHDLPLEVAEADSLAGTYDDHMFSSVCSRREASSSSTCRRWVPPPGSCVSAGVSSRPRPRPTSAYASNPRPGQWSAWCGSGRSCVPTRRVR